MRLLLIWAMLFTVSHSFLYSHAYNFCFFNEFLKYLTLFTPSLPILKLFLLLAPTFSHSLSHSSLGTPLRLPIPLALGEFTVHPLPLHLCFTFFLSRRWWKLVLLCMNSKKIHNRNKFPEGGGGVLLYLILIHCFVRQ